MCTKSKTSFGCGHCVKVIDRCGLQGCTEVVRYKMPDKDCDCSQCKTAGADVTRGREGRGRYAREIRTRGSRQSSYDSLPPDSPHLTISPWHRAEIDCKEKKWDTPTRRQADDAWIIEHERRMSDLDEKTSNMSINSPRESRQKSRRTSPTSSYERVIEADEVEEPEEMQPTPAKPRAIKMLPYEISEESDKSHSRRRSHKTDRSTQHFMPHYQEAAITPRRRVRVAPPVSEHDIHESRQLVHIPRGYGSKTEPYRPQPQSCYLNSPVPGSPIEGAHWQGHYAMVRGPLQHDAYYPRQYTVY